MPSKIYAISFRRTCSPSKNSKALRTELPTRADFAQLQSTVDGIAKQFNDQNTERIIGTERASRMEAWIIKAAAKIGLEYKP